MWLAEDILSVDRACVCAHQSLIAVCIETSVISQRSLPCRPANNQHPLCACSFSPCLFSLSSSLPPFLSPACCHNDKPHSAIVPCCSPRTKEEAISSPREEWWKWRIGMEKKREDCCEGGMMMFRVWERNGEEVREGGKWKRRRCAQA